MTEDFYYKNDKPELNFYHRNRDIFQRLENYGITIGTVSYILKISDVKAWKYERGVLLLPKNLKRKLEKLLVKLEQGQAALQLILFDILHEQ